MGDAILQLGRLFLTLVDAVLRSLVSLVTLCKPLYTLSIGDLQFLYFLVTGPCIFLVLLLLNLQLFYLRKQVSVILLYKWLFLAMLLFQTLCFEYIHLVLVSEVYNVD